MVSILNPTILRPKPFLGEQVTTVAALKDFASDPAVVGKEGHLFTSAAMCVFFSQDTIGFRLWGLGCRDNGQEKWKLLQYLGAILG